MLDSVPDKVLVCNFSSDEDFKPSPLYNNRQMRQFFGGCLVTDANSNGLKKPDSRSNNKKPRVKKRSKFEQRIFQSFNTG